MHKGVCYLSRLLWWNTWVDWFNREDAKRLAKYIPGMLNYLQGKLVKLRLPD